MLLNIKCKFTDSTELLVELERDKTVAALVEKISDSKSDVVNGRVLWNGQILEADRRVSTVDFESHDYVVFIPTTQSNRKMGEDQDRTLELLEAPTVAEEKSSDVESQGANNDSEIEALGKKVKLDDALINGASLMTGVDETQVRRCILLAKGDANYAVKLIMTCAENNIKKASKSDTVKLSETPFHDLLKTKDMRNILSTIQDTPSELDRVMEDISGKNPELFSVLSKNHTDFLRLLDKTATRATK